MSKTATVQMEISKATKGAIQYKDTRLLEDNQMYLIGTLYLGKEGLVYKGMAEQKNGAVEYPAHIKVTIEVVE